MVTGSKGFSLIESLFVLLLFSGLIFLTIPNINEWMRYQQCLQFANSLQRQIEWANLQARLFHQDLDLQCVEHSIIVMNHVNKKILKSVDMGDFSWHWQSKQALIFHANPLKNHVNGFFEINCSNITKLKLWVNRLGHTRVES